MILERERDKSIVFIRTKTPLVYKRISITASRTLAFLHTGGMGRLVTFIIHSAFTTKHMCYLKDAI